MEAGVYYLCLAAAVASALGWVFEQRDGDSIIALRLVTRVARKEFFNLFASVAPFTSRFPTACFLQVSLNKFRGRGCGCLTFETAAHAVADETILCRKVLPAPNKPTKTSRTEVPIAAVLWATVRRVGLPHSNTTVLLSRCSGIAWKVNRTHRATSIAVVTLWCSCEVAQCFAQYQLGAARWAALGDFCRLLCRSVFRHGKSGRRKLRPCQSYVRGQYLCPCSEPNLQYFRSQHRWRQEGISILVYASNTRAVPVVL